MFQDNQRSGIHNRGGTSRLPGFLVSLALALLFAFPSSAQAVPIPITTLIDQGLTITQGDKEFSDFYIVFNKQGTGLIVPPDATGIFVDGITIDGNHGLEFSAGPTGGILVGQNGFLDILITYTVTAAPGSLISDIHLGFDGTVTGDAFTNVTETVTKMDGISLLGQAQVHNPPSVLTAVVDFSEPVSMAFVRKDIFLFGGTTPNASAKITFVDQAVSQVPEPASVLLLGVGVVGFIRMGRHGGRLRRESQR